MTNIEFEDSKNEPSLKVKVNCTFNFETTNGKEKVKTALRNCDWNCLGELAEYLETH